MSPQKGVGTAHTYGWIMRVPRWLEARKGVSDYKRPVAGVDSAGKRPSDHKDQSGTSKEA